MANMTTGRHLKLSHALLQTVREVLEEKKETHPVLGYRPYTRGRGISGFVKVHRTKTHTTITHGGNDHIATAKHTAGAFDAMHHPGAFEKIRSKGVASGKPGSTYSLKVHNKHYDALKSARKPYAYRDIDLDEDSINEGYHQNTIAAIASHAYDPKVGDSVITRRGGQMQGTVTGVGLPHNRVKFTHENGKKYTTHVSNLRKHRIVGEDLDHDDGFELSESRTFDSSLEALHDKHVNKSNSHFDKAMDHDEKHQIHKETIRSGGGDSRTPRARDHHRAMSSYHFRMCDHHQNHADKILGVKTPAELKKAIHTHKTKVLSTVVNESGAGEDGTDALRMQYAKDTPGQSQSISVYPNSFQPMVDEKDEDRDTGKSPKLYKEIRSALAGHRDRLSSRNITKEEDSSHDDGFELSEDRSFTKTREALHAKHKKIADHHYHKSIQHYFQHLDNKSAAIERHHTKSKAAYIHKTAIRQGRIKDHHLNLFKIHDDHAHNVLGARNPNHLKKLIQKHSARLEKHVSEGNQHG